MTALDAPSAGAKGSPRKSLGQQLAAVAAARDMWRAGAMPPARPSERELLADCLEAALVSLDWLAAHEAALGAALGEAYALPAPIAAAVRDAINAAASCYRYDHRPACAGADRLRHCDALGEACAALEWLRDHAGAIRAAKASPAQVAAPAAAPAPAQEGSATRRAFADLPPGQQAALRCQDAAFWRFLGPRAGGAIIADVDGAASAVRAICGVASRSEFNTSEEAAARWRRLDDEFVLWSRGLVE